MRFSRSIKFFRAWSSGLARAVGTTQADQMRAITGFVSGIRSDCVQNFASGAFTFDNSQYADWSITSVNIRRQVVLTSMNSALLGNNFAGTDTHPANISQPCILYLGLPAEV
jgi:hypothetical protein